eukprot:TRINITY_DN3248_c0_g1_i3.p1 TRINITY_DN3248_c0_g1~~TRINITY_DN3248_c0_g1_i3.p1  ORF type:complete len:275 (+),score=45.70 TRINITY_DN3248_c0_g1_i3:56-880(+)
MNSSSFSGSQYGRGGQPQGGFFASQSGHDDQMDSSQGKGSQRSAVDPRTLLPVTLRQLITAETSATEDAFRIDGKETGQVTAIGVAIEVSAQATFLSFTLDDGTGRLSCRMFYDETTKADVYEGSYIRIFGKLRSHAGQRSLIVIKISPVEDHNEITFHILEAIQVHCYNQNLLTHGFIPSKQAQHNSASMNGAGLSHTSSATAYGTGKPSLTPIQDRILDFIRSYPNPSGPSIDDIMRACKQDRGTVCKLIEELCAEAFLYTTIDEEHYQIIN